MDKMDKKDKMDKMTKALEEIYNWTGFSLRHKIFLSFREVQIIQDIAAIGLELEEN